MLKSIIKFTICLLIFVLIVDPGDLIFHLKVPLFALIFLMWFFLKGFTPIRINKDILIISFILLIIPFFGIITAIMQNSFTDQVFALGFIKSFIVITLLLVIIDLQIRLDVYLIRLCLVIPLIIIPIYVFLTINPNSVISIYGYLDAKDVAKFSNRDFYGYKVVMLYYRTSPLLIFPLAYYCKKFFSGLNRFRSLVLGFLFLFTLILSGTRANMLSGVVLVVYFLFSYLVNKKNKLPFILGCVIVSCIVISFIKTLSFSQTDESSAVKSGHLDSYKLLFEQNPQYLIWGNGLGSTFYSSGNGNVVSQTELTYVDLVRWFGIPITLSLFFLLLYPVIYLYFNKKINDANKYLIVAYFGYLFIAGTNPLLVSSTGMLAIITMYSLLKNDNMVNASKIIPVQ